jgi:hypothetical protein
MITVRNNAGEVMTECLSDAEACRWFALSGRHGDYIAETGETIADVLAMIWPDASVGYDRNGCALVDGLPD